MMQMRQLQSRHNPDLSSLAFTKHILLHLKYSKIIDDRYAKMLGALMLCWSRVSPLVSFSMVGCEKYLAKIRPAMVDRCITKLNKNMSAAGMEHVYAYYMSNNFLGGKSDFGAAWAMVRNTCLVDKDADTGTVPPTIKLLFYPRWRQRIDNGENVRRVTCVMEALMMGSWNRTLGGEVYVDNVLCYKDGVEIVFPGSLDHLLTRQRNKTMGPQYGMI
jgi:hypothetical protein